MAKQFLLKIAFTDFTRKVVHPIKIAKTHFLFFRGGEGGGK